jgi:hypothetical protein
VQQARELLAHFFMAGSTFHPTFVRLAVITVLPTFVRLVVVFTEFPTFVAVFTPLQTVAVTVAVLTRTDAGRSDTYFVSSRRSRPDHKTQRRTQQYNLDRSLLGDAHDKPIGAPLSSFTERKRGEKPSC